MFHRLYTLDALSDPLYLLHLTRGHTALRKRVNRIKIGSKKCRSYLRATLASSDFFYEN